MTPIEWLEHTADVGFRVRGTSVEQAFAEAARALFSLMVDLDTVKPESGTRIAAKAGTLPELLVEWLSELLAQQELTGTVFSQFDVAIEGDYASGFHAQGHALGEAFNRSRHRPGTEVKGISYLGLSVTQHDGDWVAQVVVDV